MSPLSYKFLVLCAADFIFDILRNNLGILKGRYSVSTVYFFRDSILEVVRRKKEQLDSFIKWLETTYCVPGQNRGKSASICATLSCCDKDSSCGWNVSHMC
jgi:hypothetical protein